MNIMLKECSCRNMKNLKINKKKLFLVVNEMNIFFLLKILNNWLT